MANERTEEGKGDAPGIASFFRTAEQGLTNLFFEAAQQGNSSRLERYLEIGVPIDVLDDNGKTALHLAAENSRSGAVASLLAAGAAVNIQDQDGFTPLMHALAEGRTDIADLLLDRGADVTLHNKEGNTCAHMMSRVWLSDDGSDPYIGKLVAHGLDINITNGSGETPLSCATCYGSVETLSRMLALGANMECRDSQGDTLLHWSTAQPDKTAFYLEKGMRPATRNFRLETPLHAAGHPQVVEQLVAAGADLTATDNQGRPPLLCVLDALVWRKNGWTLQDGKSAAEDVISAFLLNGADPDLASKSGRTARQAILALCAGDASAVASTHLVQALPEQVKARQDAAQHRFLPLLQAHDAHHAVRSVLQAHRASGPQS